MFIPIIRCSFAINKSVFNAFLRRKTIKNNINMKKWEYKCCRRFQDLQELGKEGWELVCVDSTDFYLKREI